MVADLVTEHAFASVAVMVYVPADSPVLEADVFPFDQLKLYGLAPPLMLIVAVPFD